MKENKYPFIEFCKYMDQLALAEQKYDLRAIRFYIKKAELCPKAGNKKLDDIQNWCISYIKAIYVLLYGNKEYKHAKAEAVQELLLLRKKAIYKPVTAEEYLDSLYDYIKEYYVELLLVIMEESSTEPFLPEYEELCLELLEIMEKEKWELFKGKDYYSIIYMLTAKYYICQKQLMLAQQCYQKVWNRYRKEENISLPCFEALCYYMNNLMVQGEIEKALQVRLFLNERFWNGQVNNFHEKGMENVLQAFFYQSISLFEYTNSKEMMLELIEKLFDEKWFNKKTCNIYTLLFYLQYLIQLDEKNKTCSRKRKREIKCYLKKIEKDIEFIDVSRYQSLVYFMLQYLFQKVKKNRKSEEYLRQCKEILQYAGFDEFNKQVYFGGICFVMKQYKRLGQSNKILECAEYFMKKAIGFYNVRELYEENEKMEKYFELCEISFQYVYQAVKDMLLAEERFIFCLNYKGILSSVLRLGNKKTGKKILNSHFSFQQLEESLPDNTMIINFLYIEPEIYETGRRVCQNPDREYILDIFIVLKKNGSCQIKYKSIPKAEQLNKKLMFFMDKLKKGQGKMNALSKELYGELFSGFESLFQNIDQLWICPDGLLCNFSFDVLFELADDSTEFRHIVYWQSLRDIFENWKEESGCVSSCIVGNPKFELKKTKKPLANQEVDLSFLPYSSYEAVKLAVCTGGEAFIGEKAVKSVIKQGYRYIHIATHSFNRDEEKNTWYKSVLAFAGAQDYLRDGRELAGYGNGLLSAEEISKIDLHGTELVVLSACNSGNSFFSDYRQQTGLHVAFGVSGVKYIISALWDVDDFPTAVLMNYFYENLQKEICIPEALFLAKMRLRNTTVKELKELIIRDKKIMPESCEQFFTIFQNMPEEYCCYESVQYWGSFICNQAMR